MRNAVQLTCGLRLRDDRRFHGACGVGVVLEREAVGLEDEVEAADAGAAVVGTAAALAHDGADFGTQKEG
ncbi:MAG: hypothetical protein Q8K32_04415 [Archangium sp.]|nr:hypothetical protein [Archangium sp.]